MNLSELAELVQELDYSYDHARRVHERIEARGIEVSDDCGNDAPSGAALQPRRAGDR